MLDEPINLTFTGLALTSSASSTKQKETVPVEAPAFTVATAEKVSKESPVGISLGKKSDEDPDIYIANLSWSGLFGGSKLKIGQKVISINGQACPTTTKQAIAMIGAVEGPLTIVAEGKGFADANCRQKETKTQPNAFWKGIVDPTSKYLQNFVKSKEFMITKEETTEPMPPRKQISEDEESASSRPYNDYDDDVKSLQSTRSTDSEQHRTPIPERLVDYFCVIGPELQLTEVRDFENPSDLHFQAKLNDCYPKTREDMEFPDYLPMFCFPHGYRLQEKPKGPTLSTFVLTSGAGHRIYGSALTLCEALPLPELCELFWSANCTKLPSWLEEGISVESPPTERRARKSLKKQAKQKPLKQFYLPKCLVVISHHSFYAAQTTFLKQLHRISLTRKAPLPVERYIANFVHDIPLPPAGRTKIKWNCFTSDITPTIIARPAPNELPLVNFSFRPLFRSLSVSNILVLWGALMQEGRVVLRSQHMALLTPVAEALTSLLFPFTWQGMYIPVLPSHMMDVLDAPVPFLIGLVGTGSCHQPEGVVICDLDQDIIHLGDDAGQQPRRTLPPLPPKHIMRLKVDLEKVADPLYLIPPSGIKGRITTGTSKVLENSQRETYAQMTKLREVSMENTHRQFILSAAEFVQPHKPLRHEDFILIGEGEITVAAPECNDVRDDDIDDDINTPSMGEARNLEESDGDFGKDKLKHQKRAVQAHADKALSYLGVERLQYATPSPYVVVEDDQEMKEKRQGIANGLYELDNALAQKTRRTFLQFVCTLFKHYKEYVPDKDDPEGVFQHEAFLDRLKLASHNRKCVEAMIKSQMFERFLHQSSNRRKLFDELVLLEQNKESKNKQPQETPFLDTTPEIKYEMVPAVPCHVGIGAGRAFTYEGFPKLDEEELVAHNTLDPVSALCYGTLCSPAWWFAD